VAHFGNLLTNLVDDRWVKGGHQFGNQDHIGSPGNARMQGQVTGIATHHFDHHHPVVAGGGKGEIIEGRSDGLHGSVETDGFFREGHIVVDGFGNADKIPAAFFASL
jgi:hypothetical protein